MSNVMKKSWQELILDLGRRGWAVRRIAKALGVRRETVKRYLGLAGIPVRPSGRGATVGDEEMATQVTASSGAKTVQGVSPDFEPGALAHGEGSLALQGTVAPCEAPVPPGAPAVELHVKTVQGVSPDFEDDVVASAPSSGSAQRSRCEPFREIIEAAALLGRQAKAIWQDLVDDHGFQGKYATVKRFVRRLRGVRPPPQEHPVIETEPGVEGQVDYGEGPLVLDPESGRYRRTRLFVLTLGYSRKSVRLLTFRSSSRIWAELHEKAFRRLGGAPTFCVLDNLKEGVTKPDLYDPEINHLYRDLLKHYGSVALPCRVRHANRKGKVESGVGHTQRGPLHGKRFESLEQAQAYLDRWDERWADTRIHGRTKKQVAAMFELEKPHLKPVPVEPFRYYEFGNRTVGLDGCVEVRAAYYAVPPGRVGTDVIAQWDDRRVRILDRASHQLLIEHMRRPRGKSSIPDECRSPKTPATTIALLNRACRAGTHIGLVCKAIFDVDGQAGVRRILGLLSLCKRISPAAVDEACSFALEAGVPEYRVVRNYVERRHKATQEALQKDHPIVRKLTEYCEVIDRIVRSQGGLTQ